MKPSDVERWAGRVLDQIERGVRREDDRVEVKRKPPGESLQTARRIAGHANQVRTGKILWLLGLDETTGERHPLEGDLQDPEKWWPSVEKHFDEVAPSPCFVFVDDGILAVGLDVDRVPFVVKHPQDSPSREVPWRESTHIRSANRNDLLKLLAPTVDLPDIAIVDGHLDLVTGPDQHDNAWYLVVWLDFNSTQQLVIRDHEGSATANFDLDDLDPTVVPRETAVRFTNVAAALQPSYQRPVESSIGERGPRHLSLRSRGGTFVLEGLQPADTEWADRPVHETPSSGLIELNLGSISDRPMIVTGRFYDRSTTRYSRTVAGKNRHTIFSWTVGSR